MVRMGFWCVVGLLAVSSLGCGDDEDPPPADVKIGFIVPLSGAFGMFGEGDLKALKVPLDEVNAVGGLLDGRSVVVKEADNMSTAAGSREAARALIEDEGVHVIVTSVSGANAPDMADVTSSADVPMIACCAGGTEFDTIELASDRMSYRLTPGATPELITVAELSKTEGCTNVAVTLTEAAFADESAIFKTALDAQSVGIAGQVGLPRQASYDTEASDVAALNPDCIILDSDPESMAGFLTSWLKLASPPAVKWLGTSRTKGPPMIEALQADASMVALLEGSVGTDSFFDVNSTAFMNFGDRYAAKYGTQPAPFEASMYDSTALALLAIERAGSTDGVAVRDGLLDVASPNTTTSGEEFFLPGQLADALAELKRGNDIDYVGASGPVNFNDRGAVGVTLALWEFDQTQATVPEMFVVTGTQDVE